jgi:hypothetical protein
MLLIRHKAGDCRKLFLAVIKRLSSRFWELKTEANGRRKGQLAGMVE